MKNGRYAISYSTRANFGGTSIEWDTVKKAKEVSSNEKAVYLLKRSNGSDIEDQLCVTPNGSVPCSVRFAPDKASDRRQ